MTRRVREDCALFEQRILDARDAAPPERDPALAEHLRGCEGCRALCRDLMDIRPSLQAYRVRDPSEELLHRVGEQAARFARTVAEPEGHRQRPAVIRVLAAGLAALPMVVLINAGMGWALYELLSAVLPLPLARYGVGLFVLWASLSVSLSYATLPFLSLLPRGAARPREPLPSGQQARG